MLANLFFYFITFFLVLDSSLWSNSDVNFRSEVPYSIRKIQSENEFQYILSACSVFKDEAPFLEEWIEYHKLLGVGHFYLYNNDSTDNFFEVLEPYIHSNEVTLVDWPSDPNKLGPNEWVLATQWSAMSDAIYKSVGVSKWLALIDVDEFILPLKDNSIPDFLKEYDNFPGVVISWQCFGTSNTDDIPPENLLIETLTYKALSNSKWNHPVKSILKPERVDLSEPAWCPHTWPFLDSSDYLVFSNYMKYSFGKIVPNKIVINHYVHRSENYFKNVKLAKKERMEGVKWDKNFIVEWHDSCNLVEDKSILRFVPALREKMFENRSLVP